MNLEEHYNRLYKDSVQKIKSGAYEIDTLIDSPIDRFGITLLFRPNSILQSEIQKLLEKIRLIEPNQYFYPNSDLHVTVLSIISCYHGFNLNQIRLEDYIKVIKESISGINQFNIEFRGLTASPSCLMVQGHLEDNTLNHLRNNLRKGFQDTVLEQSIDKRYLMQTAHSTIFRLKEKLINKEDFLRLVETYRDFYFGTITVDTIELVFNDWYQRKEYVETLYKFKLK